MASAALCALRSRRFDVALPKNYGRTDRDGSIELDFSESKFNVESRGAICFSIAEVVSER